MMSELSVMCLHVSAQVRTGKDKLELNIWIKNIFDLLIRMHLRLEFDSGVGPTCSCINVFFRPLPEGVFVQSIHASDIATAARTLHMCMAYPSEQDIVNFRRFVFKATLSERRIFAWILCAWL